tara:strand:+ start:1978 stop:2622 length:645 start_codon:yes stop_codon:yes gene_type:complete
MKIILLNIYHFYSFLVYFKKIIILNNSMMSSIMKNQVLLGQKVSLQTCRENLNNFKEKLKLLTIIKEGDKLGKIVKVTEKKDISENLFNYNLASGAYNLNMSSYEITGEYCIYHCGMMQKFSRWWHDENYEKTFKYLDDDFTIFARYLDNLKQISLVNGKLLYGKIINDTNEFINELVKGLYNLKETYSANSKLKAKIESIILILLDFKNENTN